MNLTAEELKALLETPVVLAIIMLIGSAVNGLTQLAKARQNGTAVSIGSYLAHWPELLATLGGNVLAFLTLIATDSLNYASALGIGFMANSVSDLMRAGGRSGALGGKQDGFAHPGLLVLVAIAAAVLLSGCVTNPQTGEQQMSNTGKAAIVALAGEFADRYIAEAPDKASRIQNIRTVAALLQNVTDAVTVSELRARVDDEVAKLGLSEVNLRSWQRWGPVFEGLLQDYIGSDRLDATAYVQVNDFLTLIVASLPIVDGGGGR